MISLSIKIVDYKLYDYEKEFLYREIKKLGGQIKKDHIQRNSVVDVKGISKSLALKLTFVSGVYDEGKFIESIQSSRESFNGVNKRTQSRRYGPHGLHEYKGRFNPQMPRSLMLQHFEEKSTIMDPFMGSGTTLVEARDLGHSFIGVELNPLAYLMALGKKTYEELPALDYDSLFQSLRSSKKTYFEDEVREYLMNWFPEKHFTDLETIVAGIHTLQPRQQIIPSIVLSNLLREHSLQDPRDLRIRRRTSVPESLVLLDSFQKELGIVQNKHAGWITNFGRKKLNSVKIFNHDSKNLRDLKLGKIDGTVSSPPYATALPYIDTYRLSMVALGLITPKSILSQEKALIGARDISTSDKGLYEQHLLHLPKKVQGLIKEIHNQIELDESAGFRKKASPYALARYFFSMQQVIKGLYDIQNKTAKNFWVIGPNKIKINNQWETIDTPLLVGELAKHVGFKKVDIEPVQAYNRYGLHSKNSISMESILRFEHGTR